MLVHMSVHSWTKHEGSSNIPGTDHTRQEVVTQALSNFGHCVGIKGGNNQELCPVTKLDVYHRVSSPTPSCPLIFIQHKIEVWIEGLHRCIFNITECKWLSLPEEWASTTTPAALITTAVLLLTVTSPQLTIVCNSPLGSVHITWTSVLCIGRTWAHVQFGLASQEMTSILCGHNDNTSTTFLKPSGKLRNFNSGYTPSATQDYTWTRGGGRWLPRHHAVDRGKA